MKKKQLIYLIIALLVLVLCAVLARRSDDQGWKGEEEETILPDLDSNGIKAVMVESKGKQLHFALTDKWRLQERGGYEADVSYLGKILFDLGQVKVAQRLNGYDLGELGLTAESGASFVTILGEDGKQMAKIAFGKTLTKASDDEAMVAVYGSGADVPVGRYVLLEDGTPALVANTFSVVDCEPGEWLDCTFVAIENVKTVVLREKEKAIWSLARESAKQPLSLVGAVPAGKVQNVSKMVSIQRSFNWRGFKDVELWDGKEIFDKCLTVTDFDGMEYVITMGRPAGELERLRVSVSWKGEEKRGIPAEEKPEDKAALDKTYAEKVALLKAKASDMNERFGKWVYLMPKGTVSTFAVTPEQLVMDKPAK